MRILITGSRSWQDFDTFYNVVYAYLRQNFVTDRTQVTFIHGANPKGIDAMADYLGKTWGVTVETHKADWETHGRSAGIKRNLDMIRLGADVCLAFIENYSPGASHCANVSQVANIPTIITRKP